MTENRDIYDAIANLQRSRYVALLSREIASREVAKWEDELSTINEAIQELPNDLSEKVAHDPGFCLLRGVKRPNQSAIAKSFKKLFEAKGFKATVGPRKPMVTARTAHPKKRAKTRQ